MEQYIKLGALGQAALEALVAGVGIAVFYALGLRALAMWNGAETEDIGADLPENATSGATAALGASRNPAGLILAVLSFAVVVGIVVLGLYVMLSSK